MSYIIDWVRHAESCKNRYKKKKEFQNSFNKHIQNLKDKQVYEFAKDSILSYNGIHQAIDLGNNFIKKNDYDYVFCSAMTRTLMTCLLACRNKFKKIYIMPYICETHYNDDKVGVISCYLKKKLRQIRKILELNDRGQEYKYPEVDFSILEEYEQKYHDTQISNKKKFDEIIKSKCKPRSKIVCFSHGNFIRNICKLTRIQNTIVIRQDSYYHVVYRPNLDHENGECNEHLCGHQFYEQKHFRLE